MYSVVDSEDVGVKVVYSRAGAIIVGIVLVLFQTRCSLYTYMLAVEQVAVDYEAKRDISELVRSRFVLPVTPTGRATPSGVGSSIVSVSSATCQRGRR